MSKKDDVELSEEDVDRMVKEFLKNGGTVTECEKFAAQKTWISGPCGPSVKRNSMSVIIAILLLILILTNPLGRKILFWVLLTTAVWIVLVLYGYGFL